jgi:hypothetical protein
VIASVALTTNTLVVELIDRGPGGHRKRRGHRYRAGHLTDGVVGVNRPNAGGRVGARRPELVALVELIGGVLSDDALSPLAKPR